MNISKNGLKVFAYTVNEIESITKLCHMSVDGIITDFPDRALHAIKVFERKL